jgi:hypothetical protein
MAFELVLCSQTKWIIPGTLEALSAPRGALLYRPFSGQRLEEVSLDLMANS